jgi:hypothetical protein
MSTRLPIAHSGGHVMLGNTPLALADARTLLCDLVDDFQVAKGARQDIDALFHQKYQLTTAIFQCIAWRKAAGWTDPNMADRVRT